MDLEKEIKEAQDAANKIRMLAPRIIGMALIEIFDVHKDIDFRLDMGPNEGLIWMGFDDEDLSEGATRFDPDEISKKIADVLEIPRNEIYVTDFGHKVKKDNLKDFITFIGADFDDLMSVYEKKKIVATLSDTTIDRRKNKSL